MFDCIKIVAKTVLLILESLEKGGDSLVLFDKPLLQGGALLPISSCWSLISDVACSFFITSMISKRFG